MSVRVMSAVFARYPVGGGEMLLALALADHASDDGTRVFPTIEMLAKKTRQSERSVQRQLRSMEKSGWLILVNFGNGGRSCASEYKINHDWINGDNLSPFKNDKKGDIDDVKGDATGQKGDIDDVKGDTGVTRIEPSITINNHHKPSKAQQPQKPAFVLPDWFSADDVKNWMAWNSTPKRKKATVEQLAVSIGQLSKWRDAGVDWSQALENSAVAGWQGLFEPKNETKNAVRGKSAHDVVGIDYSAGMKNGRL